MTKKEKFREFVESFIKGLKWSKIYMIKTINDIHMSIIVIIVCWKLDVKFLEMKKQ